MEPHVERIHEDITPPGFGAKTRTSLLHKNKPIDLPHQGSAQKPLSGWVRRRYQKKPAPGR